MIEVACWELCPEDGWVLLIEWTEPGSDRVIYAAIGDRSRPTDR